MTKPRKSLILTFLLALGIALFSHLFAPWEAFMPRTIYIYPSSFTIKATVTAYSNTPSQTDDTPNLTASGKKVAIGMIACPNWLDFGVRIEIAGRKYECYDRMNRRYRQMPRFDIFMFDTEKALKFGVKTLEVKIIPN